MMPRRGSISTQKQLPTAQPAVLECSVRLTSLDTQQNHWHAHGASSVSKGPRHLYCLQWGAGAEAHSV
eukprot:3152115-Amphidinium_carterae.1